MKTSLSFLGLSLLLLHCAASLASAQAGCTLIDDTMPAQYVSYERLEEAPSTRDPEDKRGRVLLRFRNNTNCDVSLWSHQDPQDLRALAFKRRPDGSLEIRVVGPEDLPDGRRIELEYTIDYLQPLPPPKKVIYFDRIVHSLRVRSGMSFIFAVPLSRFDYSIRIQVPFRYDWDKHFYAPSHSAAFINVDLPMDVLQKTKVCSQIDDCKPAPSKRLPRRFGKANILYNDARIVSADLRQLGKHSGGQK